MRHDLLRFGSSPIGDPHHEMRLHFTSNRRLEDFHVVGLVEVKEQRHPIREKQLNGNIAQIVPAPQAVVNVVRTPLRGHHSRCR
jgi:hypothetical protein